MLPSHNCIIIDSMFSFQGTSLSFQETQWSFGFPELQSISWWRLAGSNRWPPACKAGALPAELNPHIRFSFTNWKPNWRGEADLRFSIELSAQCALRKASFDEVVGQNGLEPSTSRLSVVCSSQLSYWPISTSHFLGTSLDIPSKLNNTLIHFYPCTDLRTLQATSSSYLKSP